MLLFLNVSSANNKNPSHIGGTIKDFKGGDVIVIIDRKKQTVQVDAAGVFDYTTILKEPSRDILFLY